LWRSWSRSWSLEWVCLCFTFLYFYFKLPRQAVQWRPHANQVLWGSKSQRVLLLFNVLRSIDSNSMEVRLEKPNSDTFGLIDRSCSWKRCLHSDFDNTGPFPLVAATGWLQIRITRWRLSLCVSGDHSDVNQALFTAAVFVLNVDIDIAHASLERVSQHLPLVIDLQSFGFLGKTKTRRVCLRWAFFGFVLGPVGYAQYPTRSTCLSGLVPLCSVHFTWDLRTNLTRRLYHRHLLVGISLFLMSQKVI